MNTPDLLGVLEEIEQIARQTQLNLAAGLASSGTTGLKKIQDRASDARRHALADLQDREPVA